VSGRRVFLCYRRQDSQSTTGRLRDRLLNAGFDVLMDLDETRFGQKWREQLTEAIAQADAMLVMIGPGWLTADDDSGRRRLDQSDDEVVREIALGLRRGIPLIPVMIDGTPVPQRSQLPKQIREMFDHQVAPLHNARFDAESQALLDVLDPGWRQGAVPAATPAAPIPGPAPAATPPSIPVARPAPPRRIAATTSKLGLTRLSLRTKLVAAAAGVVVVAVAVAILIAVVSGPPRLSAAALRNHVPVPTRPSCQEYTPPEDPLQHDLRTALDCKLDITGAADEVAYLHYKSGDSLTAAY
jgi:hypothetical protein